MFGFPCFVCLFACFLGCWNICVISAIQRRKLEVTQRFLFWWVLSRRDFIRVQGFFFFIARISKGLLSGRDDQPFIKFCCCEQCLLWQEKLQGFSVFLLFKLVWASLLLLTGFSLQVGVFYYYVNGLSLYTVDVLVCFFWLLISGVKKYECHLAAKFGTNFAMQDMSSLLWMILILGWCYFSCFF